MEIKGLACPVNQDAVRDIEIIDYLIYQERIWMLEIVKAETGFLPGIDIKILIVYYKREQDGIH